LIRWVRFQQFHLLYVTATDGVAFFNSMLPRLLLPQLPKNPKTSPPYCYPAVRRRPPPFLAQAVVFVPFSPPRFYLPLYTYPCAIHFSASANLPAFPSTKHRPTALPVAVVVIFPPLISCLILVWSFWHTFRPLGCVISIFHKKKRLFSHLRGDFLSLIQSILLFSLISSSHWVGFFFHPLDAGLLAPCPILPVFPWRSARERTSAVRSHPFFPDSPSGPMHARH